jgi:ATP adenylyltransferase
VLWDDKVEIVPRWCGDVSFNAFYGLKTTPQTPSMIFESYR